MSEIGQLHGDQIRLCVHCATVYKQGVPNAYLIIDDDPDVLKSAASVLSPGAGRTDMMLRPETLAAVAPDYDAVLLDMNFAFGARDGAEGLDCLSQLQAGDPALAVVLMTTFGGVALAVSALKQGASDFILKPWRNQALVDAMAEAAELTRARRQTGGGLNLEDLERRAITRALRVYDGNLSHAAAALGLTRPALYRRMARYEL